jgi:uncharacterized protein YodC (DUF2158 family)
MGADTPSKFRAGDLVRLKSGGPDMTVECTVGYHAALATDRLPGIHCDWFIGSQNRHAVFKEEELEKAPTSPQPDSE